MLSKCLNPRCSATFRYLRQGRLFRVDHSEASRRIALTGKKGNAPARGKTCPVEHFWLCESCAATMTIDVGKDGRVRAVPFGIPARMPPAAAAPPIHRLTAKAS
jgi:hypothetical protein